MTNSIAEKPMTNPTAHIGDLFVPFDLTNTILSLSIDSLRALKTLKLVSKDFKNIVENTNFMHPLLIKFQGNRFSDLVYAEDPRKFLVLNRDITKIFLNIVLQKST